MANAFLAWNNRIDGATLAGGSWQATLPLVNLQSPVMQKVARSSSTASSSTQFTIDLGAARAIGVVALLAHTISDSGYARITGAETAAAWTNLAASPSDFTNAAWTKNTVTVTANATAGPDGSITADRLAATGADSSVMQGSLTVGASSAFKYGMWLRADAPVTLSLNVQGATTVSLLQSTVCNVTTEWQLFTVAGSTGAGDTAIRVYVGGWNSFSTGEAVYAWGADVVVGNGTLYDSGWDAVWPSGTLPPELLNWEDTNFWFATLSVGDLVGLQSPFVHILSSEQYLRHWRVEISDTFNTGSYIDIGRCIIARGWRPGVNYSYGAEINFFDISPSVVTLSGTSYFDQRPKGRMFRFSIDAMSSTEAYSYALDMQRVAGVTNEVLLIPDSDDTGNVPLRSFAGRLTALQGIGVPDPSRYTGSFELKEII
jgi:hypothetical protein